MDIGRDGTPRTPPTGGRTVLCCGLVTLDVVQRVHHVPAANEKLVAESLELTFGGPAANAAATAAALGVPARLVTAVGSGPVAELLRAELAAAGVEVVDLAAGRPYQPPVSSVLVTRSTGDRAVVSVNATRAGELSAVPAGVLDDVAVVLVDGHHLSTAVEVATRAQAAGVPVVLDGGSWKDGLERLLAVVDHAILSADFRAPVDVVPAPAGRSDDLHDDLSDDVRGDLRVVVRDREQDVLLRRVLAQGPRTVSQSAGDGPICSVSSRNGTVVTNAPIVLKSVSPVVDTVGAGDVLHGAFAAFVARSGGHVDLADGLAFAAGVASSSVRFPGARGWVASRTDHRGS